MTKVQKYLLLLLRLSLGWLFFYAGITKVLNPEWSAAGYLKATQTLPELYTWLSLPTNISWVNFLNEWGLTLLGLSLIVGLWVKWSGSLGVLLMALYYIPILHFPYVGYHSLLIDEHVIYSLGLLILVSFRAGHFWGLDARLR